MHKKPRPDLPTGARFVSARRAGGRHKEYWPRWQPNANAHPHPNHAPRTGAIPLPAAAPAASAPSATRTTAARPASATSAKQWASTSPGGPEHFANPTPRCAKRKSASGMQGGAAAPNRSHHAIVSAATEDAPAWIWTGRPALKTNRATSDLFGWLPTRPPHACSATGHPLPPRTPARQKTIDQPTDFVP